MTEYKCEICNFYSKDKTKYVRHCSTKKHLNNNKNNNNDNTTTQNMTTKATFSKKEKTIKLFGCKYCFKDFGTRQSRDRHQTKYCKYNEMVPYQKLAELLNEKDAIILNNEMQIDEYKNKYINLEKEVEKIKAKMKINHIDNSININGDVNNTILNFQLLNHNNTNYDFLSDNDIIQCIKANNYCVKALIEKVHFNKNHPENMNIYISCLKGQFIMVYKENKWQICDRKQHINDLYQNNETVLEAWFDEYNEKYPHIINSFTRYLHNKETNNELVNQIKKEILMMLYNKRDVVENQLEKSNSNNKITNTIINS